MSLTPSHRHVPRQWPRRRHPHRPYIFSNLSKILRKTQPKQQDPYDLNASEDSIPPRKSYALLSILNRKTKQKRNYKPVVIGDDEYESRTSNDSSTSD